MAEHKDPLLSFNYRGIRNVYLKSLHAKRAKFMPIALKKISNFNYRYLSWLIYFVTNINYQSYLVDQKNWRNKNPAHFIFLNIIFEKKRLIWGI